MKVSVQATISKVTTMADRTIRLQVDAQEIDAEQMAGIFSLKDSLGHFFFQEDVIRALDLQALPKPEVDERKFTMSQRLRLKLKLLWEKRVKQNKTDLDCEAFYQKWMDEIMQQIDALI